MRKKTNNTNRVMVITICNDRRKKKTAKSLFRLNTYLKHLPVGLFVLFTVTEQMSYVYDVLVESESF